MDILKTSNATGRHRGPKRKLRAGYRAPSLKRTSPHRLPLCQISFYSRPRCWASPQRKIAYSSLTQSLTQLLNHPAYLMPQEPKLSLRNNESITIVLVSRRDVAVGELDSLVKQNLDDKSVAVYTFSASIRHSVTHWWWWSYIRELIWLIAIQEAQRRDSARWRNGQSRSLKVIRCYANRRAAYMTSYSYDFPLNSNLTSNFNRSWDITLSL